MPPSSTISDLPRVLDGVRLERLLGRGGMGEVYEAVLLDTGRRAALKVLPRSLAASPETRARFEREARLAAAVTHPSCVFVLGALDVDGAPAIAMELMTGRTLEDELAGDEPVPVARALEWIAQVVDGLEAAHLRGVLHRDVKPSNCFLTEDGRVKVGDFGLARAVEEDVRLTDPGTFVGTPLYASPEQVRGRPLDVRSDLYSVGATLYALLAGGPPFGGASSGEVLARVLAESPEPLSLRRPDVPRGLERVVLRAMAKDPAARFPTYAALRRALHVFRASSYGTAGLGRRFAAVLVDSLPLEVLNVLGLLALLALRGEPSLQRALDQWGADAGGPWTYALFLATGAAYFALGEGRTGRSPGKWLLGLRVVDTELRPAGPRRALVRALAFSALMNDALSAEALAVAGAIAAAPMLVDRRRRGLHELLSGTRTIQLQRARGPRRAGPESATDRRRADDLPATLGGFEVLGEVARTPGGRLVAARDARLGRGVWLHVLADGPRVDAPSVEGAQPRPLGRVATELGPADVHEDPGGAALRRHVSTRGRVAFPEAHGLLLDLARLLAADPSPASPDRLWIDGEGRLRRLSFAVEPHPSEALPPGALLAATARELLGPRGDPDGPLVHAPLAAEPLLRELLGPSGDVDADGARRELERLARRRLRLRPARRWAAAGLPLALLAWMQVQDALSDSASPVPDTTLGLMLLSGLALPVVAFALRVPLGLGLFGIGLRRADGARAGRLRCAVRTALLWLTPLLVALPAAFLLQRAPEETATWVVTAAALAALTAQAVSVVRTPARSVVDRLSGTVLVPR